MGDKKTLLSECGGAEIDADRILRETFVAEVEHLATVDSTNNRAAILSTRGGARLPLLVVADQQTAGRGQGSKRWWTARGALTFSLLVEASDVAADVGRSPLVALATGAAVVEAVAPLLPGRQVGMKWPNDVMVDGKKLVGILVDVLGDRRHVIGIGINVNNSLAGAPDELGAKATSLVDLAGREFDRTQLLADVLTHLEAGFLQLQRDPEAVTIHANAFCLQHGRRLSVECGGRTISGVCWGIAADGALLLETSAGMESVYSGVLVS
jgi:BirA family transcriptional regulator, biotin operon repressor / biotin---[acetyl-CoA-carboxylase] ligase